MTCELTISELVKAAKSGRVATKTQVLKALRTNEDLKCFLEKQGHRGLSGKNKEEMLGYVVAHFRGLASSHTEIGKYVKKPGRAPKRAAKVHKTHGRWRIEVHQDCGGNRH